MFAINFMIHVLNCLFESRDALLSKIKPDVKFAQNCAKPLLLFFYETRIAK